MSAAKPHWSQHFGTSPKPIIHPVNAPGLEKTHRRDRFVYHGTAEAMIDAGLALAEWLPGQPACPTNCYLTVHVDDRRVEFRRTMRGTYFATFHLIGVELELLKEALERENAIERERDSHVGQEI